MRTVIGIDPGLSGAIAHLSAEKGLQVCDMPTVEHVVNGKKRRHINVHAVRDILIGFGPVDVVVVEKAGSRPGEGATSAFTNGRNFGLLEGLLVALDRPYTLVTPQSWTKYLAVGSDKGEHRLTAMRLFPAGADLFSRVKDDGRADAALLAYYARAV